MMNADASLTVSIANQPGDIDKAIEKALSHVPLDDFRDKIVAVKPNDTTASASDKTACTQARYPPRDHTVHQDAPPEGGRRHRRRGQDGDSRGFQGARLSRGD